MRSRLITSSALPGDLLVIEAHVAEDPWGFRIESLDGVTTISGANFRRLVRSPVNLVNLERGEVCIVTAVACVTHPTVDTYYVVLVRGDRLGVYTRFLQHAHTGIEVR